MRDAYSRLKEIVNSLKSIEDKSSSVNTLHLELDSVLNSMTMISVKDRLPVEHICDDGFVEPSEYCLCYDELSGYFYISRYWKNRKAMLESGNEFNEWTDLIYANPTHWIYLKDLFNMRNQV